MIATNTVAAVSGCGSTPGIAGQSHNLASGKWAERLDSATIVAAILKHRHRQLRTPNQDIVALSNRTTFSTDQIAALLTDVATGRTSVNLAMEQLSGQLPKPKSADVPLTLDLDRQRRCGFPEVIYGAGKSADLIAEIIRRQRAADQDSLATRVTDEIATAVQQQVTGVRYNELARCLVSGAIAENAPQPLPPTTARMVRHVAVITAGSTDAPVAEEAIETLQWMRIPFRTFNDIGVAGPDRLLSAIPELRLATAVIVIAGMEGALPAAVGGHLAVPVFAVPTSVGYGATLGGLTPLMGMLSSCASNVAVVNIDAGFKAAYLSGLVIKGHDPMNASHDEEE
ncbi:nickel pincer cofactor biosynthesis protein LarB [Stieleria sp. JC731]|uniref:nickel pincer cofactor biosynthesis protein LarB n=1 Tax=Pirellulaceae TaxID=2691357 RepID=UPI001E650255|nr:nickel pincer cofactor biosynthesis protein LarB [Stieleria sp. JC731]MCC9599742.1 nickel pincer cofactor biosynthesis protein LarB [Stieleria sp. JC731]